jgi:hypothetical protein
VDLTDECCSDDSGRRMQRRAGQGMVYRRLPNGRNHAAVRRRPAPLQTEQIIGTSSSAPTARLLRVRNRQRGAVGVMDQARAPRGMTGWPQRTLSAGLLEGHGRRSAGSATVRHRKPLPADLGPLDVPPDSGIRRPPANSNTRLTGPPPARHLGGRAAGAWHPCARSTHLPAPGDRAWAGTWPPGWPAWPGSASAGVPAGPSRQHRRPPLLYRRLRAGRAGSGGCLERRPADRLRLAQPGHVTLARYTDHWRGAAASRGTHRAWRYAPITGSGRPQDCSLIYPPAHIEPWSATRQRARSRSAARGPAARRRTGPGLNHRPYTGPKPRVNQSGGDLRTPFLSSVFVRFGPERAWRRSEGRP